MLTILWRAAALWLLLPWSGLWIDRWGATGVAATTISLSPSNVAITGCETVEVQIRINDVTDLYGADVWLAFDPSLLEVVDADLTSAGVQITNGGLLAPPLFFIARVADNTAGTVHYAATQLHPASPVTGSGILARVQFRAKSAGSGALRFSYTMLSDRSGVEIQATPIDGGATTLPPDRPELHIRKLEGGAVRLSWISVTGVAQYRLFRGTVPDFTPIEPATCTAAGLECDDAAPPGAPGEDRYYTAKAICANGFASAPSNLAGEVGFALEPGG